MPRSRQAEVQSVVSWHEVVRARHRLFGGIGRGGQQKGAAGETNDLEHCSAGAMRVAVEGNGCPAESKAFGQGRDR